jgi:hypothetical protein
LVLDLITWLIVVGFSCMLLFCSPILWPFLSLLLVLSDSSSLSLSTYFFCCIFGPTLRKLIWNTQQNAEQKTHNFTSIWRWKYNWVI